VQKPERHVQFALRAGGADAAEHQLGHFARGRTPRKQNEPLRHRAQSPKTVSLNLRPMKKNPFLTNLSGRVTIRLPAEPRTVVLHRSRKGFGFVLRGAKATSPLMELTPSERCPALQYLDDVDLSGVADVAGLKKGDYLLEVSDPNKFQMRVAEI
jgi:hypothetical protein